MPTGFLLVTAVVPVVLEALHLNITIKKIKLAEETKPNQQILEH